MIFGASSYYQIPFSHFSRDILAVLQAKDRLYIGLFSNIGGFFWAASFGVCLFSYFLWRNIYPNQHRATFFLWGAFFTVILYTDDMFLMHDAFFPSIGISGRTFVITYGGLLLVYLGLSYRQIFESPFIFLILAFGFFGLSLSADTKILEKILAKISLHLSENTLYVVEDGCKLLGIISWLSYYSLTSLQALRKEKTSTIEPQTTQKSTSSYVNH
jgi:hypothetical protein